MHNLGPVAYVVIGRIEVLIWLTVVIRCTTMTNNRFRLAGRQSGPRSHMIRVWKTAQIRAQFGHDHLRRPSASAGDGAQQANGVLQRVHAADNLRIEGTYSVNPVYLLQNNPKIRDDDARDLEGIEQILELGNFIRFLIDVDLAQDLPRTMQ